MEEIKDLPATKLIHDSAFISRLSHLQTAFSRAHYFANQYPSNSEERKRFLGIAKLIWQSCGRGK